MCIKRLMYEYRSKNTYTFVVILTAVIIRHWRSYMMTQSKVCNLGSSFLPCIPVYMVVEARDLVYLQFVHLFINSFRPYVSNQYMMFETVRRSASHSHTPPRGWASVSTKQTLSVRKSSLSNETNVQGVRCSAVVHSDENVCMQLRL